MRNYFVIASVFGLALSACQSSESRVSEACPLIAATSDDQKLERLNILVKAGYSAQMADADLEEYERGLSAAPLGLERKEYCLAVLSKNEPLREELWTKAYANHKVAVLMAEQKKTFQAAELAAERFNRGY